MLSCFLIRFCGCLVDGPTSGKRLQAAGHDRRGGRGPRVDVVLQQPEGRGPRGEVGEGGVVGGHEIPQLEN